MTRLKLPRKLLTTAGDLCNAVRITSSRSTPHTVKLCGFFVPVKTAINRFYGANWFMPRTKAGFRPRTNKGSRCEAVIATSCTTFFFGVAGLFQTFEMEQLP